jgi:hypothetical protein
VSEAGKAEGPQGIGGWLLMLTICLLLFPGFVLFDLAFNQWPIFAERMWSSLTTPGSRLYHPFWAPLIVGGVICEVAFLAFDAVLLSLLLRKSRHFPGAFVVFALLNISYFLVTAAVLYQIPIVAERGIEVLLRGVIPPVLAAGVWIAYVRLSRRVRNTFKAKGAN